ncbi:hypothetical protein BST36_20745 [Mycolicibacterium moriokaense]|uniref:Uncharacterized protein n=1 Tax=Mycolicibacterium moriokaense TaxID=39691 RepID=A0AAD1HC17_9MYCO|nr:hypothetical protein [Mycolicibacterium moriokaense]MCV7039700.1 hypothetical protein [Mycolicibacterium moriokaense]ORB19857.1 hypothetical protein BST36_20745 [Mycolicibacterium moriokaense]BBX01854.1 hypothetical protein MMOR_27900 [Mycolicibacterium moriokaense]
MTAEPDAGIEAGRNIARAAVFAYQEPGKGDWEGVDYSILREAVLHNTAGLEADDLRRSVRVLAERLAVTYQALGEHLAKGFNHAPPDMPIDRVQLVHQWNTAWAERDYRE